MKRTLVVTGDVWALKYKGVQHQEMEGMMLGMRTPESRGRVGMGVIMAYIQASIIDVVWIVR